MTSECFVYMTLPGSLESVIAGRFRLINSNGEPIGEFVYARSYLSRHDRVELDPVELKLRPGSFRTTKLGGVFGAIRDAAPDSWGRKFIDKRLGILGNEVDYLLNSPDDRAGALGFGFNPTPPAPIRAFNRTMDLSRLKQLADDVIAADSDPSFPKPTGHDANQVGSLLRAGTSMGGARPKTTVEHDGELWLAKFARPDDRLNNPRVEHAVTSLARNCGLNCAETQVETIGDTDVVLVKRFDRQSTNSGGYLRSRMISALTVLGAEERRDGRWSYLSLAEEMTKLGMQRNLPELFLRMCFNCLISNMDDHPRNHAYVAAGQDWMLSPAYDLTPTPVVAIERRDLAMIIGDGGRYANRANLLSQCERFRVTRDEAEVIVDDMAEQVRSCWYHVAKQAGVTERDCELIASAFAYEGFDYELPGTAFARSSTPTAASPRNSP